MFSPISSQHVHQPATVAAEPTTQPHTATGMEALMAKLEQAIADLSAQLGGPGQGKDDQFTQSPAGPVVSFPGGGGGLANGGMGAGPMGGVIGNKTSEGFAAFGPVADNPVAEEHRRDRPQSSAAGGVIGNKWNLQANQSAHLDGDHGRPKSSAAGGVIGNKTSRYGSAKLDVEHGGGRPKSSAAGGVIGNAKSMTYVSPKTRFGGIRPAVPERPDIPVRGHSSATGGVIGNKGALSAGLTLQSQAFLEPRGGFGSAIPVPTKPADYPINYLDGKGDQGDKGRQDKLAFELGLKGGGAPMGGVIGDKW